MYFLNIFNDTHPNAYNLNIEIWNVYTSIKTDYSRIQITL